MLEIPRRYSLYLIYWYQSTKTDANAPARDVAATRLQDARGKSPLYLLCWYKSTNTDAIPEGQEAQHRKRKREEPRASARDSMQVPASVFVLLYE